MAETRVPLPPFAALRAFHAAAVHGRFRDAALSLGVTESAISHQVRRLEDFLRTALFDRSGSGVGLTAAGGAISSRSTPRCARSRRRPRRCCVRAGATWCA
jgi:LysR family glycine cleavage system transcriptional activator